MTTEQVVAIERLIAAQTHLGDAIASLVRSGKPYEGVNNALAAVGEAQYWLGRADAAREDGDDD